MVRIRSSHRSTCSKLVPVPGLIVSTLVSVLLIYGLLAKWTATGRLYSLTIHQRASVQIIVHVAAWLLGSAQTFTLYTLFRAALNMRIEKSSVKLDVLKLWMSVSGRGFDMSLPVHLEVQSIIGLAVLSIPGLLWAGALTPVLSKAVGPSFSIPVPRYSPASASYWTIPVDEWDNQRYLPTITNQGTFSDQPIFGKCNVRLLITSLKMPRQSGPLLDAGWRGFKS